MGELPRGQESLYLLGWSTAAPALEAIILQAPKHVAEQRQTMYIFLEDQRQQYISHPQAAWPAEDPGLISQGGGEGTAVAAAPDCWKTLGSTPSG